MKPLHGFCLATLMLGVAGMVTTAEAKGMGGPIHGMVMFRSIKAVVLAHEAPDGEAAIIVDRTFFGSFKQGERVPVETQAYKENLSVPGGGSQSQMFLVLTEATFKHDQDHDQRWFYGRQLFAKDLLIDEGLSRRVADGRVYFWPASTKAAGYSFWKWFTDTAPLARDETHSNLASLESDLTEGLSRHDEWTRAQAATDPAEKLRLLRPFLLPGGPHKLSDYEFWSCSSAAMEEAEKAGPVGVPFLEQLLKEPAYQKDYAPQGWRGLGAQERALLVNSLAMLKAQLAEKPQEKLAALRPVFDVPTFEMVGGFDGVGVLQQYFDRALVMAVSVDAVDARAFLQGLLTLPQFQEGYSPIGETSWGHDFRQKINAALTSLH